MSVGGDEHIEEIKTARVQMNKVLRAALTRSPGCIRNFQRQQDWAQGYLEEMGKPKAARSVLIEISRRWARSPIAYEKNGTIASAQLQKVRTQDKEMKKLMESGGTFFFYSVQERILDLDWIKLQPRPSKAQFEGLMVLVQFSLI